jgi:hypothetical protein
VLSVKIEKKRPMALLAVCAQVSEWPTLADAPIAHAPVGYGAVATDPALGTTLAKAQRPQATQVRGTSGFAIKVSVNGMDPVGGVRGKPPRGWPV